MKRTRFIVIILLLTALIFIAVFYGNGHAQESKADNIVPLSTGMAAESSQTATTPAKESTPVVPSVSAPPAVSTSSTSSSLRGKVIDAATNKPLAGAVVTLNRKEVINIDPDGTFPIPQNVYNIAARAIGYTRSEVSIDTGHDISSVELRLKPIRPKALYLTVYGIGSKVLRNNALSLIAKTDLNALVIDMKGDRGLIPYRSSIPIASDIGALKVRTVHDIKGLIQSLKDEGIYTIARIVVFKDNLLGTARPDLAVKTTDGKVWHDREQLAWVDPSRKEVWEYNIQIAVEAAQNGFDEIQFDYIRFPDRKGLKYAVANTEENRVGSIMGFLKEARRRLQAYNVFLSADIFGYVAWNYDDTQIGQRIDRLAPAVDYISPMLYPSSFHLGIPGYRNPVVNPYEIVYLTLKKAQERTKMSSVHFRPWLQSFKDYAYDRRPFTGVEIRKQTKAAEDFGSDGWMLWNPHNIYSPDGLKKIEMAKKPTILYGIHEDNDE